MKWFVLLSYMYEPRAASEKVKLGKFNGKKGKRLGGLAVPPSFLSRALMMYCESKSKRLLAVYHNHSLCHLDNGLDVNISSSSNPLEFVYTLEPTMKLAFFPAIRLKGWLQFRTSAFFRRESLCANLPFILYRRRKIMKYA